MIKKIIILSLLINFTAYAQDVKSQYDYIKDKALQQIVIQNKDNEFTPKILSDIDGFTNSIGFLQHFFSKKGEFSFDKTYEIYRQDKLIQDSDKNAYFQIGEAKFIGHENELSRFEISSSKTLFKQGDLIIAKGLKHDALKNIYNTELKDKIYLSHILNKNEGSFFDTVLFKQNNELKIGSKLNIYREAVKIDSFDLPPKKIGELIITDFQGGYAIGFISKTTDFITLKDYVK